MINCDKIVQINNVSAVTVDHNIYLRNIVSATTDWLTYFLQFMIENGYFDVVNVSSFDTENRQQSLFIKIPNNKIFQELTEKNI